MQFYILVKLTKTSSVKYIFYLLLLSIAKLINSTQKIHKSPQYVPFNESVQFYLSTRFTYFNELSTRMFHQRALDGTISGSSSYYILISFYSRARGIVQIVTGLRRRSIRGLRVRWGRVEADARTDTGGGS